MRNLLERVMIKHLRKDILHFLRNDPTLTSNANKTSFDLLSRNLDIESSDNLKKILNRFCKLTDQNIFSYEDLFTPEEYAQYEYIKNFGREITEINEGGGYYQYKHYRLPVKRFGNETFVYRHGIDKLKTLNTLTNTKAILDIGAFVGDSALIFAEEFPQNPIFCFEPNPTNFSNALTTFKLNNLDTDRIKLYNIAIGAHSGHGKMLDASAASYLAFQEDEINENADIEVTTVDNFTISNGLDVGLIKIDVEGGEQDVLEGAIQVLKTQKPILLVSIYHHYEQFVGIKPWIENLNLGYKFDFFWGVSGKINEEIMLLCEVR